MKKMDFHRSLLPRPVFAMAHRKLAVESMTQILQLWPFTSYKYL